MPDTELLTDQQIAEIEARANAATEGPWIAELRSWPIGDTGDYEPCADVLAVHGDVAKPRAIGMFHELSADVNAQAANCAFTAHARADIPALIATVKQRWQMLATTIENLQETLAKYDALQSKLEQLRAENERLQTELEKESHIADDYAVEADNFRTHMIELCKGKSAELRTKAERAHNAGHLMVRDGYNTQSRAIDEVREELEKLT